MSASTQAPTEYAPTEYDFNAGSANSVRMMPATTGGIKLGGYAVAVGRPGGICSRLTAVGRSIPVPVEVMSGSNQVDSTIGSLDSSFGGSVPCSSPHLGLRGQRQPLQVPVEVFKVAPLTTIASGPTSLGSSQSKEELQPKELQPKVFTLPDRCCQGFKTTSRQDGFGGSSSSSASPPPPARSTSPPPPAPPAFAGAAPSTLAGTAVAVGDRQPISRELARLKGLLYDPDDNVGSWIHDPRISGVDGSSAVGSQLVGTSSVHGVAYKGVAGPFMTSTSQLELQEAQEPSLPAEVPAPAASLTSRLWRADILAKALRPNGTAEWTPYETAPWVEAAPDFRMDALRESTVSSRQTSPEERPGRGWVEAATVVSSRQTSPEELAAPTIADGAHHPAAHPVDPLHHGYQASVKSLPVAPSPPTPIPEKVCKLVVEQPTVSQAPVTRPAGCSEMEVGLLLKKIKKRLHMAAATWPDRDDKVPRLVESVRQITEALVWGERHDGALFDLFCEHHMLASFVTALHARATPCVLKVQLLQSLQILAQNARRQTSSFYLLSGGLVNSLFDDPPDLGDEEVLAYFTALLKGLALRLDNESATLCLAPCKPLGGTDINNKAVTRLPIFERAVALACHRDSMVRSAARTALMSMLRLDSPHIRDVASDAFVRRMAPGMALSLRAAGPVRGPRSSSKMSSMGPSSTLPLGDSSEDVEDLRGFASDLIALKVPAVTQALVDQLGGVDELNRLLPEKVPTPRKGQRWFQEKL